jgi:ribosomal protein S18 acetylase RimI-like enzyme
MKVRPATRGDLAFIRGLHPELRIDDPPPSVEELEAILPELTVAEREGSLAGYARLRLSPVAVLANLVTAPAARRTGAGKALLVDAASRARSAGQARWSLNVRSDNAAAIALYRRFGFIEIERSSVLRLSREVRATIAADAKARSRVLTPDEGVALEQVHALRTGALSRGTNHAAEQEGVLAGLFGFSAALPGCRPFFAVSPASLGAVLAAIEPLLADREARLTVTPHQQEITGALLRAGGELRFEVIAMEATTGAR